MSIKEKLLREFETLTEAHQNEVIDFIEFLKMREEKNIEKMMDEMINANLEALKGLEK